MADAELPKDKKQVNAQSARLKELRETLIELEKKKSELEKLLKKRSRQVETISKQRTMDIAEQLIIEEALRQSERRHEHPR